MAYMSKTKQLNIKYHEARNKWPISTIRPHETTPGYSEHRLHVNNKQPLPIHPSWEEIHDWKLKQSMLITERLREPRRTVFVETERQLKELKESQLEWWNEFAIDTESYSGTYFPSIMLIQISSCDTDYVIDAIALHSKIHQYLHKFFNDPNILKICHSCNDIIPLQRNFDIFPVGMIDTQEAYFMYEGKTKQIGLANMAKILLDIEMNKSGQMADWSFRPLHPDLIEYAAKDTQILFKCWIALKEKFTPSGIPDFPLIKQRLKETISSRQKQTATAAWDSYRARAHNQNLGQFITQGQEALFMELHDWRDKIARQVDVEPSKIKIERITRSMPTKKEHLKEMADNNIRKLLQDSHLQEAIDIINIHKPTMFSSESMQPSTNISKKRQFISREEARLYNFSSSEDDYDSDSSCFVVYQGRSEQVIEKDVNKPLSPEPMVTNAQTDTTTAVIDNSPATVVTDNAATTTLAMTERAKKLRRNRLNRKLKNGLIDKRPKKKVNKTNSAAKRVAAVLKTALRYNVTQSELLTHIAKMPNSLKY